MRMTYGARRHGSLSPLDASLNLPEELHSHGLRLAAVEAARRSFDATVEAIERNTGARLAKRQAEELVERAAQDFDAFYDRPESAEAAASEKDLLVLSLDGKGIVMLRDDLRGATRKAAESAQHKLHRRLSKGEKRDRKRMATVAAVYDLTPQARWPEDVLAELRPVRDASTPRPRARDKRGGRAWRRAPWQSPAMCSRRLAAATRSAGAAGWWCSWTATVTRSPAFAPRPSAAGCPRTSRSSSTSSTCSSTCGTRPGASSPRATRTPRSGSRSGPSRSCRDGRARWRAASAVAPPSAGSPPRSARARRLRGLPHRQAEHAPLPPLPSRRAAHRHGCHRGRLPPPHRRPPRLRVPACCRAVVVRASVAASCKRPGGISRALQCVSWRPPCSRVPPLRSSPYTVAASGAWSRSTRSRSAAAVARRSTP